MEAQTTPVEVAPDPRTLSPLDRIRISVGLVVGCGAIALIETGVISESTSDGKYATLGAMLIALQGLAAAARGMGPGSRSSTEG